MIDVQTIFKQKNLLFETNQVTLQIWPGIQRHFGYLGATGPVLSREILHIQTAHTVSDWFNFCVL